MEVWSWVIFAITTLVAIFVALYAYGLTHLKHIKENWVKYRCDPIYMPLAGAVGSDVMTNFMHCSMSMIHKYAGFIMDPIHNSFGIIGDVMSDMQGAMNDMRGMMNSSKTGFLGVISGTFGKIQNTMSAVGDNVARMRTLMGRSMAAFAIIADVLDTGIKTGESVANGPIGSAASFLCFSPDTILETERGNVPFSKVKVGDVLAGGHTVKSTMMFDGTDTEMYRLGRAVVSGNHKVVYGKKWIRVEDHPDAAPVASIPTLYCLNTDTHEIPVGSYVFKDFEETSDPHILRDFAADVEFKYNGTIYNLHRFNNTELYNNERGFARGTMVKLVDGILPIEDVRIGDRTTGGCVVGIFKHGVSFETVEWAPGIEAGQGSWIFYEDGTLGYAGESADLILNERIVYHLMTEDAFFDVMDLNGQVHRVLDDQELADATVHDVRDARVQEGFIA